MRRRDIDAMESAIAEALAAIDRSEGDRPFPSDLPRAIAYGVIALAIATERVRDQVERIAATMEETNA